jgi:hypothetical protein
MKRWKLPAFRLGVPQRLAALLLLVFLGECAWVIGHQSITTEDYRYARCGREMWEHPSPLVGYFTTCGNLNGDGTFAYRAAGLPLTAQRLILLGSDLLRKPADRLYTGTSLNGSTYEARHEISHVLWLLHLPFAFFAAWLGGGLWWVSRRLFGNAGGFLALLLYCFNPEIVRHAVSPNNEVLAMWGVYGLIYTAIGVAHALQGPRHKWTPRIVLLAVALGLSAAAHLLAAMIGFVASLVLMFYLAERRRSAVILIAIYAALGALAIEFACFSFRLQPFTYVFTGGAGRFWFSLAGPLAFAQEPGNWPLLLGAGLALFFYAAIQRSRYFGNTVPLVMTLVLAALVTTQVRSEPWLWAVPFLITFLSGVFADLFETKQRRLFFATALFLVLAQIVACLQALPALAAAQG